MTDNPQESPPLSVEAINAERARVRQLTLEIGQGFVQLVGMQPRSIAQFDLPQNGIVTSDELEAFNTGMMFGANPFLPDAKGKTPLDHLLGDEKLKPDSLHNVFSVIGSHGYCISALRQQYAAHPAMKKSEALFVQSQETCRAELGKPEATERLWNKDQPSPLLLSACGLGVLQALFEQPALKNDHPCALALYKRMEATLPPQCKEFLHTGMDLLFLREAESPERPTAVANALKRKIAPPGDKSGPSQGGRE